MMVVFALEATCYFTTFTTRSTQLFYQSILFSFDCCSFMTADQTEQTADRLSCCLSCCCLVVSSPLRKRKKGKLAGHRKPKRMRKSGK